MLMTLYKTHLPFELANRQWPNNNIESAPNWCSLDLYIGQQSLLSPMNMNQKLKLYNTLITLGFKEISISNPADSDNDKVFLERLIDEDLIPNDVTLQITLPCDVSVIKKSIPLLKNLKKVTIQLEVPCSLKFSSLIFSEDRETLKQRAIKSARLIKELVANELKQEHVSLSISFEDFMGTKRDFLLELSNSVAECFLPLSSPLIIHLPNTIDYSTANHYADGVEWFIENFAHSKCCIFSAFSKNNRGNAVAATELALRAGATRVEGTLLGIGERAGNNDLITMVLNLQSSNINPGIAINNINDLAETIQETSRTSPPTRHPYVGELSFTALSSYQQNIIFKGLTSYEELENKVWDVPYLNLNPVDVGRVYESVNYQVGDEENDKVIQVLSNSFGFQLPKLLAAEFSNYVKQLHGNELDKLAATEIRDLFMDFYSRNLTPIELKSINFEKATLTSEEDQLHCQAEVEFNGEVQQITGSGDGAIDTLVNAITSSLNLEFDVASFNQHSLTRGSSALAATYIKVVSNDAKGYWGVGIDSDSTLSAIKAFFNALNRSQQN